MKFLKKISQRGTTKIKGKNNKVIFLSHGQIVRQRSLQGLSIHVKGNDNIITLHLPLKCRNSNIIINGNNNNFEIEESTKFIQNSQFLLDQKANNRKVHIGNNFLSAGADFIVALHDSILEIGNNCMISYDVHIRNHDGHTIYNADTEQPFHTKERIMKIGHNVWIGFRSIITKNLILADGTIVGAGSVVTKSITDEHIIIAGNPAKKIKTNIRWDHKNLDQFEIGRTHEL